MFTIPFDGPDLVGKRAVVHTTGGLRRGLVRALGPDGLDIIVELPDGRTRLRHFDISDILVVARA